MEQRTIGEQLGLGKNWQPGQASWGFASFDSPNGRVHVVIFDTAGGRSAIALTPDDFRRFAAQALEASSGLIVAES